MEFLHSFSPSPILAELGPFLIRWYGLALFLGAVAGFLTFRALARRAGWSEDRVTSLTFFVLLFGFLGARLYHVLNEPSYYWNNPLEIVQVWHGGLAIHGGLLAGLATIAVLARRWKRSVPHMTDLLAPAVVLGQAIGRWGNYFNQELFGRPTGLPFGIPIDPQNRPERFEAFTHFHPTFLYESLWDIAVFLVLMGLHRGRIRAGRARIGLVTALYILLSSLGRFATEFLRIDQTPLIAGVRLPLLVSGALVLLTGIGIVFLLRQPPQLYGHTHDA